ncbi:MAG: chromosome segregation protein SMC, partial [Gammaproteobacteria bacterium]|nr:chromosome segregation protein SMC [Gammaproteobacteria bacterium]
QRATLSGDESVITPEGVWFGLDWITVDRAASGQNGALEREQQIRDLKSKIDVARQSISRKELQIDELRERVQRLESQREQEQRDVSEFHEQRADLTARLDARRSLLGQQESRRGEIETEAAENAEQITDSHRQLDAAQARRDSAEHELEALQGERRRLESQRDELGDELDVARNRAITDRGASQDLALQVESRRSTQSSMQSGLERMRNQLTNLQTRVADLEVQIADGQSPLADMQSSLAERLEKNVEIKEALTRSRGEVEEVEERLRGLDQERLSRQNEAAEIRDSLDEVRLTAREVKVRREALLEQFEATGFELAEVTNELDAEASIESWAQQLEELSGKISRLGPINLAAIDEFKEESERKEYLDAQHADLTEALATLENAIRKIDKETKSRFKETFEKVNLGFKDLFPQLFGGGQAYLELTGDDLLSAGVTVMARPPGKRNSTIHLLSGGEKALTAVALVFAIFQLNPSPFCMLDEVDAPLDDANVERYCDIVRKMSEDVQFIFITHNKITMELANQLVGVTMGEPGVSRLVSVDVDSAVQMAAV